jgi:hypothetical protein
MVTGSDKFPYNAVSLQMPDDGAALPLKNQFGSASEGGEGEEQGEEEGEEEGDADIEWVSMREEWDPGRRRGGLVPSDWRWPSGPTSGNLLAAIYLSQCYSPLVRIGDIREKVL